MKRPFQAIRELLYDIVKQNKETTKSLIEQVDKLMVWIVGFSVGGISLIVGDIAKLPETICHDLIKLILILLTISIISGILFRIACFCIQIYNSQIQVFVETSLSDREFMDVDAKEINDDLKIDEVLIKLKIDFGEDASTILQAYSSADISEKVIYDALLADLKSHYNKLADWARKDHKLAIDYLKDTLHKAYGISEREFEKLYNANTGAKWRFWVWTSYISFLLSCLTFISVVIILCWAY